MSKGTCEKTDESFKADLLSNPFIKQKWIPQFLCGANRWKVLSGKWEVKSPGKITYSMDTEVEAGENLSVTGSPYWSNYTLHVKLKFLTESVRPPQGGAIIYYHFKNIKNYYSVHICIHKRKIEIIKRYLGGWITLAGQEYDFKQGVIYDVSVSADSGLHQCLINGTNLLGVRDSDIPKGRIGIGTKYCNIEISHASIAAYKGNA